MHRRSFMETLLGSALGSGLLPAAPVARARLGFASYSIRSHGLNATALLEYAAAQKVDIIQLSVAGLGNRDEANLRRIKDEAGRLGIQVEPAYGGICTLGKGWNPQRQGDPVSYVTEAVRVARAFGSPTVRCTVGGADDRYGKASMVELMDDTMKTLRAVRSRVEDSGVKLAFENHGELRARELATVIEEAGKGICGVCYDSGNPLSVMEDPLFTMEILGPYIVSSHFRDFVVYEHPRGAAMQWVAMGDGMADFGQLIGRFRQFNPTAPVLLEIITGNEPKALPYLEPDFWKFFPGMVAADFARFVALAKKGYPFLGSMVVSRPGAAGAGLAAAIKEQQRADLERSLEYCRKRLDLGQRWRG